MNHPLQHSLAQQYLPGSQKAPTVLTLRTATEWSVLRADGIITNHTYQNYQIFTGHLKYLTSICRQIWKTFLKGDIQKGDNQHVIITKATLAVHFKTLKSKVSSVLAASLPWPKLSPEPHLWDEGNHFSPDSENYP